MTSVLLALDNGAYLDQDCVEVIHCLAYRLDPVSPGSFNDLDGEVIDEGPIQGQILPSAIRAFCNIGSK
jgi:diacylglycerol kinase family enzyme